MILPSDVVIGEFGQPFKTISELALFLIAPENEEGEIGIVQFQVWNHLNYRTTWVEMATNALVNIPEVERCFRRQSNQRNSYRFRLRVFNAMCQLAKIHGLYGDE